jgi:hypothetical protein
VCFCASVGRSLLGVDRNKKYSGKKNSRGKSITYSVPNTLFPLVVQFSRQTKLSEHADIITLGVYFITSFASVSFTITCYLIISRDYGICDRKLRERLCYLLSYMKEVVCCETVVLI